MQIWYIVVREKFGEISAGGAGDVRQPPVYKLPGFLYCGACVTRVCVTRVWVARVWVARVWVARVWVARVWVARVA